MLSAAAGHDVQMYPQYYVPYDRVKREATAHAKPLSALKALNPGRVGRIEALPAKLGLPASRLGFLPMRAGKHDLTVIIDRSNGDYLGNFDLRPWRY